MRDWREVASLVIVDARDMETSPGTMDRGIFLKGWARLPSCLALVLSACRRRRHYTDVAKSPTPVVVVVADGKPDRRGRRPGEALRHASRRPSATVDPNGAVQPIAPDRSQGPHDARHDDDDDTDGE